MTREEKIYKLADRTSQSVLDKINELEREIGYTAFRNKFKTITCDNGVEFTKHKEIEHSCTTENIRTSLYFCHPFCSCERGSNENANKLIRKYIPKGCDIGSYTDDDIKRIENLINNYPRRLFNGLSTNQYKLQLGL
jgi:IS30 family transposase